MPSVYAERRAKALKELETGILILFSAPVCFRNNDVAHEYRQDSDFYYLTGFDEAESVMVLAPASEHPFQLFVLPKNPERETWDGERTGVDGAIERYAADAAYPISELPNKLPELLKGKTRLFYAIGRHPRNDDLVLTALGGLRERIRRGETCPTEIIEPSTVLHEMRMVKSPAEIDNLRRAIAITAEGHDALLNAVRPGIAEYELEAVLRGKYRALGSERCAYPPIVASGRNARVLHPRRKDRPVEDGEWVLVDAAAEYG